ncbi:hypothetical protein [Phenylobacterium sp.]|jgi:invasion protein IalB|uniref:hypothetical protein n=1 Tax=Phenylobacterium sp. TaxID=1871053 RepID=UPI002F94A824
MIAITFAATLLLADAAAQAATPTPVASSAPAKKEKVNKDGLVCKKEAVLGSRMPTKVCMTAEQWEERKASDRDNVDRQQRVMQAERG